MPDDHRIKDVRRLTADIASGDPEAFALFYKAKFDHVYAVARKATGFDEQACLDIVQDTMMRAIRYMKPFDQSQSLSNWLVRVTRSVAFDHLRKERRRRTHEQRAVEGRPAATVEPHTDLFDRIEWLRREMRGIDGLNAAIVEMRYRAGLTLEAIGQRLGMGTGAVHGRLTRTIAKLQKKTAVEVIDE